jgi:hypothetical protein
MNGREERPVKSDKYIGMDVHQATTVVVVLNNEGKVVVETIVATERASIRADRFTLVQPEPIREQLYRLWRVYRW